MFCFQKTAQFIFILLKLYTVHQQLSKWYRMRSKNNKYAFINTHSSVSIYICYVFHLFSAFVGSVLFLCYFILFIYFLLSFPSTHWHIWNQCMKCELVDKWMTKHQMRCWQYINVIEWNFTAENCHAHDTWITTSTYFEFLLCKNVIKCVVYIKMATNSNKI